MTIDDYNKARDLVAQILFTKVSNRHRKIWEY